MILGLDISTTRIGYCLLEDDGLYIDIGHIELSKIDNFYMKCVEFRKFLDMLKCEYDVHNDPFYVFVEKPLMMFKSNESMAQVISLLQRFNAVCCYLVQSELDIEPQLVMEITARKNVGIKVPKGVKKLDKKKYVLDFVKSLGTVPDSKWELKRTGTPKDFCYDQADAFVIAKAGTTLIAP